jgi:hypothetical protein
MNKEEVLEIIMKSVNADNKDLCLKAGMSDADAESQIQQSQPSLNYIMGNVYDKLKEAGALA